MKKNFDVERWSTTPKLMLFDLKTNKNKSCHRRAAICRPRHPCVSLPPTRQINGESILINGGSILFSAYLQLVACAPVISCRSALSAGPCRVPARARARARAGAGAGARAGGRSGARAGCGRPARLPGPPAAPRCAAPAGSPGQMDGRRTNK